MVRGPVDATRGNRHGSRKDHLMISAKDLPITDEQEDMEEAYERVRVESLSPELQALVAEHHWNALQAAPSYTQRALAEEPTA